MLTLTIVLAGGAVLFGCCAFLSALFDVVCKILLNNVGAELRRQKCERQLEFHSEKGGISEIRS